jgi:LDH2 family malate/lactate/ureidoglycolate dehydrogenase
MPTNWAITADGRTTDDPAEAMDGTLLPMGEYKGYGLSLITDVLTGVLSGGAFGTVPYSNQARQEVAHQFIAYDIDWFMARDDFYANLRDFMRMVKASRPRPGVKEILLPGELEWRRQQEKLRTGVPLDPEVYEDLKRLTDEVGVIWPLT